MSLLPEFLITSFDPRWGSITSEEWILNTGHSDCLGCDGGQFCSLQSIDLQNRQNVVLNADWVNSISERNQNPVFSKLAQSLNVDWNINLRWFRLWNFNEKKSFRQTPTAGCQAKKRQTTNWLYELTSHWQCTPGKSFHFRFQAIYFSAFFRTNRLLLFWFLLAFFRNLAYFWRKNTSGCPAFWLQGTVTVPWPWTRTPSETAWTFVVFSGRVLRSVGSDLSQQLDRGSHNLPQRRSLGEQQILTVLHPTGDSPWPEFCFILTITTCGSPITQQNSFLEEGWSFWGKLPPQRVEFEPESCQATIMNLCLTEWSKPQRTLSCRCPCCTGAFLACLAQNSCRHFCGTQLSLLFSLQVTILQEWRQNWLKVKANKQLAQDFQGILGVFLLKCLEQKHKVGPSRNQCRKRKICVLMEWCWMSNDFVARVSLSN